MKIVKKRKLLIHLVAAGLLLSITLVFFLLYKNEKDYLNYEFSNKINDISLALSAKTEEVNILKNDDQLLKNTQLETEIKNITDTYQQTAKVYEDIADLRISTSKTEKIDNQFSSALSFLSARNYASASSTLLALTKEITSLKEQLAAAKVSPIPENIPASNSPPDSGYKKQVVEVDGQKFVVDILSANLNSVKVQVETASDSDCANNCPVSTLASYVSKSGGFAGINGPYFCPAEYPSCSGKTNSFDTLLMNKNKYYFNSGNNVYSNVPAMIFSGNSVRLVERSSEWGRDTSVDAVIANQPLLLSGGEIRFTGDSDPKKISRGTRSFIASNNNMIYIGVVRNASIAEVAKVLKALGIQSAINLDSGGSTAFYINGKYLAGPGRQTPFGIVLVRK